MYLHQAHEEISLGKLTLQNQLSQLLKRKVELDFNSCSRVFVRICRLNWRAAHICLHPLFLTAPESTLQVLASFVRGDRRAVAQLKNYVYSARQLPFCPRDPKWQSAGAHHDLQELLLGVCERYFPNIDPLRVTWFTPRKPAKRSITLGQFDPISRLIKIHRRLDDKRVPPFFLRFVLYHEALHSLHSPRIDDKNRFLVHTRSFKRAERQFAQYAECRLWQRDQLWTLLE